MDGGWCWLAGWLHAWVAGGVMDGVGKVGWVGRSAVEWVVGAWVGGRGRMGRGWDGRKVGELRG